MARSRHLWQVNVILLLERNMSFAAWCKPSLSRLAQLDIVNPDKSAGMGHNRAQHKTVVPGNAAIQLLFGSLPWNAGSPTELTSITIALSAEAGGISRMTALAILEYRVKERRDRLRWWTLRQRNWAPPRSCSYHSANFRVCGIAM